MKYKPIRFILTYWVITSALAFLPQPLEAADITIEYEVWMEQPQTHYFDVAVTVTGLQRDSIDFVMPVWTPGSYLIREYARHVTEFTATRGSGTPLKVEKINKSTWRVRSNQATKIIARYRAYAFINNMRENYLDELHAYINGASLFMYVDGFINHPVTLKINPAPGWDKISTGLDLAPGQKWIFQAPDYDVLADGPIEIGTHTVYEFAVQGVPHRIAIYGIGNYDPDRLVADVKHIVETAIAIFGEIPYKHYTFLVHLGERGSGGIEHANSTSLGFRRWGFQPESAYRHWLGLVAHEFFHLWNVKRIRPKELGPFDYTRENHTRMLWVAEGFTGYYDNQILRRAGFITEAEYLEQLARTISNLQSRPGRRVQSVTDASFDAWIKFYRENENSANATVSYYTKGEVLGALLDLEIRHRTGGARSLDDVMRTLYEDFYKKRNVGYTEEEFRQVCARVAGGDLSEFFDRYVYDTVEINYDRYLHHAGLRLELLEATSGIGYFGARLRDQNGKVVISTVVAGSPAQQYGVYVGDEVLAINGLRVTPDNYADLFGAKNIGEPVTLTIARDGILRTLDVVLGERPVTDYRIVQVEQPTPEQDAIYRGWVHAGTRGSRIEDRKSCCDPRFSILNPRSSILDLYCTLPCEMICLPVLSETIAIALESRLKSL